MKKMLMKLGLIASLTLSLMACSSGIKLDTPPVEDRSATQISSNSGFDSTTAQGQGIGQTDLTQSGFGNAGVTDPNVSLPGPANASKIIYFDYDSYQIRPEFAGTLETHARWLNANRNRRAALEGHTDSSGGREYNLALGQKRADAVRRSLAVLGVSDQQMESVSFGKEKPADLGAGEMAMAKNRRVEIFYR